MTDLRSTTKIILIIAVVVVPALVAYDYVMLVRPPNGASTIAVVAGVWAYFLLGTSLTLTAKLPRIQNALPYDRAIAVHAAVGAAMLVCGVVHGITKVAVGFFVTASSAVLSALSAVAFLLTLLWVSLPGTAFVRKIVGMLLPPRRRWNYDRYKRVHRLLFGITVLAAYWHVLEAGSLPFLSLPTRIAVHAGTWLPIALLLASRWSRVSLVVESVHMADDGVTHDEVTRDGVAILACRPIGTFRYRGGQFVYLHLNGRSHPFSILSAPGDPTVRFAIRVQGRFTQALAALRPGERITSSRPLGSFGRLRRPGGVEVPLCFIGTGIGIVPVIGALRAAAAQPDHPPIRAVLAVPSPSFLLDDELLRGIERADRSIQIRRIVRDRDRTDIGAALSAPAGDPEGNCGGGCAEDHTGAYAGDTPSRWMFFICSSNGVRTAIIDRLRALGVPDHRISYERFSLAPVRGSRRPGRVPLRRDGVTVG